MQIFPCIADVRSVIGTSSLRRAAQLRRCFSHLQIADVVSFVVQHTQKETVPVAVNFICYFDMLLCIHRHPKILSITTCVLVGWNFITFLM